jgi:hypothetical protein
VDRHRNDGEAVERCSGCRVQVPEPGTWNPEPGTWNYG